MKTLSPFYYSKTDFKFSSGPVFKVTEVLAPPVEIIDKEEKEIIFKRKIKKIINKLTELTHELQNL